MPVTIGLAIYKTLSYIRHGAPPKACIPENCRISKSPCYKPSIWNLIPLQKHENMNLFVCFLFFYLSLYLDRFLCWLLSPIDLRLSLHVLIKVLRVRHHCESLFAKFQDVC